MVPMLVCAALLVSGLAAGLWWGGRPFSSPERTTALTVAEAARRYVWYAAIMLVAGVAAGITVIGGGGRLAMRLLAVTAGADAQGRMTEAEEVVGRITVDGTIGFVLFSGIFVGLLGAASFLLVRRYLPAGRLGGVVFGLGLLVVFGTTLDPLRRQNPDFDIVGPGWLAVVVFGTLAAAFGLALEGIASRMSTWLPLLTAQPRDIVRYAAAVPVLVVAAPVTVALLLFGLVTVVASRWRTLVAAVRSRGWVAAGRALLIGLVVVASAAGAVSSMVDIAGR